MGTSRAVRVLFFLLGMVLFSSCNLSHVNYFPVISGQRFDLQADGTGHLTHVEIKTSDPVTVNGLSFATLGGVDVRFTKDDDNQMPESGTPHATLDYILHEAGDQWTGVRSVVSWQNPGYPVTTVLIEFQNSDRISKMVVPPSGLAPGTYYGYGADLYGGYTPSGFVPEHVEFPKVLWMSKISYHDVNTPLYKGSALVNEMHECAMPISLSEVDDPLKCSIETWSFAPAIGLVQIDTKWAPVACAPYCPPGTPPPSLPPALRRIN